MVNTASMAGLIPGVPSYDASEHAVVAISEDLYQAMNVAGLPIGVSGLCPSWVRTSIVQADRNWPQSRGEVPPAAAAEVLRPHMQRVMDEGMAPAAVADLVADAVAANRFWVFTDPGPPSGRSTDGSASPKASIPRSRWTCPGCRPPSSSPRTSSGCWPAP